MAESHKEKNKQEMLALFHIPEIEFDVKEILFNDLFNEKNISSDVTDMKLLFYKLWRKIEQKQKQQHNKHYLKGWMKIAAAVIIGLLIGIVVTYLKNAQTEPGYYAAYSPKGSVSQLIMPDSTIVFLNADSHIKYCIDEGKKTREVFLEGEAWFDVTQNKKKPFIVHTSCYDVKVTGTQFNIKAYKSDHKLTTTLEKGQILIRSNKNYHIKEDIVVHPSEQVILNKKSKQWYIKNVNTKWFTSWKDNKLIFVNMDFKSLMLLLERKYGVDIEVINKEILELHFDGIIKNETIIEFLEIMKQTLPIDYRIVGQKIEITNMNQ